jgi:hypothetical protein
VSDKATVVGTGSVDKAKGVVRITVDAGPLGEGVFECRGPGYVAHDKQSGALRPWALGGRGYTAAFNAAVDWTQTPEAAKCFAELKPKTTPSPTYPRSR